MSEKNALILSNNIRDEIAFAAKSSLSVLLLGETGTGKSKLAREIHKLSGKGKNFVHYHASARNLDIIASELFGYTKGAFTGAVSDNKGLFATADLGTLFIDEVDSLNYEAQNLLLNVLQEKTYRKLGADKENKTNFRLITASNKPLDYLLEKKIFRLDFYHRISQICIELPTLRSNPNSILKIAEQKISAVATKYELGKLQFSHEAEEKLHHYDWPGNIRELEHCVMQAAERTYYNDRKMILSSDLKYYTPSKFSTLGDFRTQIKIYEAKLVRNALEQAGGNKSLAAKRLKLDRSSLNRILKRAETMTT